MKKLLLSLVFLFFLKIQTNAQTSVYHPFPDSNTTWRFHFFQPCGATGTGDENYSIIISGDTLINGQTYHKLVIPYIQSYTTGGCGGWIGTGYQGAIRQDIPNKKVFIVPVFSSTEQLLYDFTMQVGDTVRGYIGNSVFPGDIVSSIDSVLVGSGYRKKWSINMWVYFIEGIGSTYGLILPSPGNALDPPVWDITCFQQNGQSLYPDTTLNCSVISGVGHLPEKEVSVSLSPNPVHTTATLTINSASGIKNGELKIFNAVGAMVLQKNINGQSTIINRKTLPDGIYFYRVSDDQKTLATGKFVIE